LHLAPEHGPALVEEARGIAHELGMTALLSYLPEREAAG
jgi:hypothetical protein